ncbi:MAG: 3-methyl-2-oxobutanoate dehydrogenase [Bdellovibrionales bacterium GWC1_52_8]|nr:MAG: 3-methyl-2-oxobutanoate dehydrogenase [Bdellovibrionales bacterium GWB1_52_6]OFZ03181.1 MAG: 3-methyl-2-oxobutanoate dehydrogenase [Bdellovibrionales bacterium GWA1_52_35]OFZ37689.1 MAG: 3-methyl-2-oxobutanoate dehydrogenase [Bdellovibrionales bacterium GWC1_52_8]
MFKANEGYFWIGGPGEEAFQIPLGLQIHKGEGRDFDFLHLHYRSAGIILAMGAAQPIDFIRQMKNTASDPFSGGRNFGNHASVRKFNIVPITSTIETQFLTAIGGGIAHRRQGGKGITITTSGEAGTAEGDFASALVWSSRPKAELPMLMIVTNNGWGISTDASTQHGEKRVADRATAFGIRNRTINGLDVDESFSAISEAMAYVRTERKPFLLEVMVSRMYGHSSASGGNLAVDEADPLAIYEKKLETQGVMTRKAMDEVRERSTQEMLEIWKKVRQEPLPDPSTIYDNIFYGEKGRSW